MNMSWSFIIVGLSFASPLVICAAEPEYSWRDRYARYHCSYTPSELRRRGWRRMELNLQRHKCSEDEVSEISGFYDKLIGFYSEAKHADMVDLIGSVPVAVNTADESVMDEVNGRLMAIFQKDFGARNKILDFEDPKAFDEYCKLNLAVVRFLGSVAMKRGICTAVEARWELVALEKLKQYKEKFEKDGCVEFLDIADRHINHWIAQIESKCGLTRAAAWFQVSLQYGRIYDCGMSCEDLLGMGRREAAGLIRIGYTPKWLDEMHIGKIDFRVRSEDSKSATNVLERSGWRRMSLLPFRADITEAQSNELVCLYSRAAHEYQRGDLVSMNDVLAQCPPWITNVQDVVMTSVAKPLTEAYERRFVFSDELKLEWANNKEFENYMRMNMELARYWGVLESDRGGYCGEPYVYEAMIFLKLKKYYDEFKRMDNDNCASVAAKLSSEWMGWIDSNGYLKRYLWMQVSLNYDEVMRGDWTLEYAFERARGYADVYKRNGYVPRWMNEFYADYYSQGALHGSETQ